MPSVNADSTLSLMLHVPADVCPDAPPIRVLGTDERPLFCLVDVCRAVGINNPAMVANRLDADEKGISQVDTLGGKQELLVVTEPGLYTVLVRSDKPAAKPFRRWVCHDVLPCIRKHGCYPAPAEGTVSKADPVLALLESAKEIRLAQIETEKKVAEARQLAEVARAESHQSRERAEAAVRTARAALDQSVMNHGHFTVLGWNRRQNRSMTHHEASRHGIRLSCLCRERKIPMGEMTDPRFGRVNTYPEDLLAEYFGDAVEN